MNRIHYQFCPVCNSAAIENVLHVKDYTVSAESFEIAECSSCSVRFTQDVPDAGSIGPYYKSEDYISHTNTATGLINRLYHFVRNRTIVQKRKLVEKSTGIKAGQLLDIGSGTGAFLNEMKKKGWKTTGLEPDIDARNAAKKIYNIELADTAQLYQLPADHFEAITLWHVLEHVHDLSKYVQQIKTLLHPNGKLFIAVPNYTALDATTYKEYWAAYDVPRHLYHFSPRSMQLLMGKHGLKVLQYRPMWYDSFYVSLLSSKYKNARLPDRQGKTNWLAAFWNGLRSNLAAIDDKKKCSSVIYVIGK
jgi:2-polyprenyl-3-methyl-5-hydroxy-6-metoxy-1,4-benzoquinol methylase